MQEEHICHRGHANAHTSASSNPNKCSSSKDAAPCMSSCRSAVSSDTQSRYKDENRSPAVDVRNRRPYEWENPGEYNGNSRLVRGFGNCYVLRFRQWNKRRVDKGLGARSEECEEGDLEQDPDLQPPVPIERVYKLSATLVSEAPRVPDTHL